MMSALDRADWLVSALDRADWLVERLENLAMDIRNNDRIDFADEAAEIRKYIALEAKK